MPLISTEKEADEIAFQTILLNKAENPKISRVVVIASHLTVSNAFLRSILRKHLLGVLFLPNP